jgi:hypothetical protein
MLRRAASVAIVSFAFVATATITNPAAATNDGPVVKTVATGLDSPRKLSFAPNGDLYIAESGASSASPGPCFIHPAFGETCVHDTGAITKLTRHGDQSRVLEGLPAAVNSSEALGPFDVLVHGNTLTVSIGLGASLENRDALGEDGALLGTVIDAKIRGAKHSIRVRADMIAWEAENDVDGAIDSNPVDLARHGRDLVVTDAGGNDVLLVGKKGGVQDVLAVLDPVLVDPPFPGAPDPFPAQPVPTTAVQGPDGAWYISQLTGFPFQQGASTIYRLEDGVLTPYATGLTNVTDIAWYKGSLYAVQISDAGLLNGPIGSLLKVDTGGDHTTIVDGLFAPYGVAIRHGFAYVTVGSVAPGGSVIKVRL